MAVQGKPACFEHGTGNSYRDLAPARGIWGRSSGIQHRDFGIGAVRSGIGDWRSGIGIARTETDGGCCGIDCGFALIRGLHRPGASAPGRPSRVFILCDHTDAFWGVPGLPFGLHARVSMRDEERQTRRSDSAVGAGFVRFLMFARVGVAWIRILFWGSILVNGLREPLEGLLKGFREGVFFRWTAFGFGRERRVNNLKEALPCLQNLSTTTSSSRPLPALRPIPGMPGGTPRPRSGRSPKASSASASPTRS